MSVAIELKQYPKRRSQSYQRVAVKLGAELLRKEQEHLRKSEVSGWEIAVLGAVFFLSGALITACAMGVFG